MDEVWRNENCLHGQINTKMSEPSICRRASMKSKQAEVQEKLQADNISKNEHILLMAKRHRYGFQPTKILI